MQCDTGGLGSKFGQGVNQVVPGILSCQGLCAGFYEAIVQVEKGGV